MIRAELATEDEIAGVTRRAETAGLCRQRSAGAGADAGCVGSEVKGWSNRSSGCHPVSASLLRNRHVRGILDAYEDTCFFCADGGIVCTAG
jgi:hypothetical protein